MCGTQECACTLTSVSPLHAAVYTSHNATEFSFLVTSFFFFFFKTLYSASKNSKSWLNRWCMLQDLISQSWTAAQHTDDSKGCELVLSPVWVFFNSTVHNSRDKSLMFLIPNLKIRQLPDLLTHQGSFNWQIRPQFDKILPQGPHIWQ